MAEELILGATYDEARAWSVWLRVFTPRDMADAMAIDVESLRGFLVGLERNGTIRYAGSLSDDGGFEDAVYEFVPLPPGPKRHPVEVPPERLVGYGEVICPRGMPVRIRTERSYGRAMSTPGSRGQIKRREQRYQRMREAVRARREKHRLRDAMLADDVRAFNERRAN
jgi:hypothetical protein